MDFSFNFYYKLWIQPDIRLPVCILEAELAMDKIALKQKILDLIKKTEDDLVELEDMTQPVVPENSLGRISRMDAINNKSVMEASLRNNKRKLSKLRAALQNIDLDDFGLCSDCKNPIPEARILFMPETNQCVRCASRR